VGATTLDALLERLVALNAQRAREEAAGHIRWLRPEFQDPSQRAAQSNALSNQELPVLHSIGLQADLALENTLPQPTSSAAGPAAAQAAQAAAQVATHAATQATAQAWPADLPAQVRAVAKVLASASAALTLPQLEAHFKGRGAWKNSLPRILATLEALGKAQSDGAGWRA
jgi:hypothetical protein